MIWTIVLWFSVYIMGVVFIPNIYTFCCPNHYNEDTFISLVGIFWPVSIPLLILMTICLVPCIAFKERYSLNLGQHGRNLYFSRQKKRKKSLEKQQYRKLTKERAREAAGKMWI